VVRRQKYQQAAFLRDAEKVVRENAIEVGEQIRNSLDLYFDSWSYQINQEVFNLYGRCLETDYYLAKINDQNIKN
jgi:hypothetical protein